MLTLLFFLYCEYYLHFYALCCYSELVFTTCEIVFFLAQFSVSLCSTIFNSSCLGRVIKDEKIVKSKTVYIARAIRAFDIESAKLLTSCSWFQFQVSRGCFFSDTMRRPNLKWLIKSIIFLLLSLSLLLLITIWISTNSPHTKNFFSRQSSGKVQQHSNVSPILKSGSNGDKNEELEFIIQEKLRKDWHDYENMYRDLRRIGIGEHGQEATLNGNTDRELENKLSLQYGYNALLSDAISLNRSLPDVRNER